MEFGVVLQTNPPATRVVQMMQRAEGAGFSYGWTWDSHVLWQEPFVIYDPQARQTLSVATHHMNVDYSAYEGMRVTGRVETVLSRGRFVLVFVDLETGRSAAPPPRVHEVLQSLF